MGRRKRKKRDFHYSYRTSRVVGGGMVEHVMGCKHFKAKTKLGARMQLSSFVGGDFQARRGGSFGVGLCPPEPGAEVHGSSWQLIERVPFDKPSFAG